MSERHNKYTIATTNSGTTLYDESGPLIKPVAHFTDSELARDVWASLVYGHTERMNIAELECCRLRGELMRLRKQKGGRRVKGQGLQAPE